MNIPSSVTYLLLLLLSCLTTKGQEYPKISIVETLSPPTLGQLYTQPDDLKNVKQGMALIEGFLQQMDVSHIDSISNAGYDVLNLILKAMPSRNLQFEIVAVTSLTQERVVFAINEYLIFPKSSVKIYQGIIELGADLQKKTIVFPIYDASYTVVKYPHIEYRLKTLAIQKSLPSLVKGEKFTSFILDHIKERYPKFLLPQKPVEYIIAGGYFQGMEYFGIHYYFVTSRFFRTSNTIIDVSADGFYKHELMHYVFASYKFCSFLDEGVATFFSGGEGKFGVDYTRHLGTIKSRIKNDKIFAALLDKQDALFDMSLGPEMYLTSALLLYNYYKKVGEKKFYEVLIQDLVTLSEHDALWFFKRELRIKQISDFILTAEPPVWTDIYNYKNIE